MFTDLPAYPDYHNPGLEWLDRVPRSWNITKLKRVVNISGGMTPSKERQAFWSGNIPWVTPKDMKVELISESIDRISQSALEETGLSYVQPGTVLIVVRGMILARTIPIALTVAPVTINQDMKALVPSSAIRGSFLAPLLRGSHQEMAKWISESGHGTRKIETSSLLDFRIPVPPIEDQRLIVRYLTHANARIDRAVDAKRRLIALLKEQNQVVINQTVTRGLDPAPRDERSSWPQIMLGQLLQRLEQGWSPRAAEGQIEPDQWSVLTLSSINGGRFRPEAVKPIEQDAAVPEELRVVDGDLLMTRSNTRPRVGDVAVAQGVKERTIFSDLIYRLTLRQEVAEPSFIAAVLRSRWGRLQIERAARGSSDTMPKLSQSHIRALKVPLPPLAEQRAIVEFIGADTATSDAAIDRARREIELLEEFRTRLTADVVTGQVDVREIAAGLPKIDPAEVAGDVTGGHHDDLNDEAADYLEDVTA